MKTIIHRANLIQSENDPLLGIKTLYFLGYNNFEIDLWIQDPNYYKFCHPKERGNEYFKFYRYNDCFLEELLTKFDNSVWFIDIKFNDLGSIPVELIQYISSIPKSLNVVIISTSVKLLESAHRLKLKTGLILKKVDVNEIHFKPDFFIISHNNLENKYFISGKTIVYFEDKEQLNKFDTNLQEINCNCIMIENPLRMDNVEIDAIDLELKKIDDIFYKFGDLICPTISHFINNLLTINKEQWDLEDLIRNPSVDLNNALEIKKNIDLHNEKRITIINEIDDLIIETYNPSIFNINQNCFTNSESIGRLLDKILILIIRKIYFIKEFSKGHENYEKKIILTDNHLRYQISILINFIKNIKYGTASYAPEGNIKDYKPREFKINY